MHRNSPNNFSGEWGRSPSPYPSRLAKWIPHTLPLRPLVLRMPQQLSGRVAAPAPSPPSLEYTDLAWSWLIFLRPCGHTTTTMYTSVRPTIPKASIIMVKVVASDSLIHCCVWFCVGCTIRSAMAHRLTGLWAATKKYMRQTIQNWCRLVAVWNSAGKYLQLYAPSTACLGTLFDTASHEYSIWSIVATCIGLSLNVELCCFRTFPFYLFYKQTAKVLPFQAFDSAHLSIVAFLYTA